MEDNLVSVIIASYNHEKYIQETLQSIINQTYKNIELILIDDGSKDSTYEKVLEMKPQLEERFVNLHIEKQKNMGCSATVKKLVSLANGKYIFSIASDDVAKENAIEVLYNFLNKNSSYVCAVGDNEFIDTNFKSVLMDENKQIVSKKSYFAFQTFLEYAHERYLNLFGKKLVGRNRIENMDSIPYCLLWFDHLIPIGLLIKTDIMRKVTDYNINTPVDDIYLHFQLTKLGKLKVLKDVLIKYRLHAGQTINDNKIFNNAKITRLYEIYLLDTKYPEFKTKELEESWWYNMHKEEWEESKNSPLWDEEYYTKKYPEVLEQGYIPIIHYICIGSKKGYIPSKYFESIFHHISKRNMLLKTNRIPFKNLKIKQRYKLFIYCFIAVLAQIPILDLLINKKIRKSIQKKINKYWR